MWTFSYSLRRCSSENSCQIFLSSLQIQSSFELKPKSQFELTHGNEHFCFCEWVLVNGAKDHGWLLWTNTNTKTHKLISNEFKKQNLHKFHIIKKNTNKPAEISKRDFKKTKCVVFDLSCKFKKYIPQFHVSAGYLYLSAGLPIRPKMYFRKCLFVFMVLFLFLCLFVF